MQSKDHKIRVQGTYQRPLEISDHVVWRCAQRFFKTDLSEGEFCRDSSLGRRCRRLIRRLIKDATLVVPSSERPDHRYIYCGTRCLVVCGHVVVTIYVHRRHRPGMEKLDRLLQAA